MDSSDEKRREEIEDWDLDELFFEKEKQIQEAESRHQLASAQYEARFRANSDSREVKKSVARKSPVTEELEIPLADDFGLSSGVRLTLQLAGTTDGWGVNDKVEIKMPRYKDLKETAQKHFGPLRGEDFAARYADHLYEYLDCRGAYLGEKLVGAYYFYTSNGYTCVDGLIVDEDYRNRHIATTLLKHAVDEAAGNVVFLHADAVDTPRTMYEKLGFRVVDRRYEYLSFFPLQKGQK